MDHKSKLILVRRGLFLIYCSFICVCVVVVVVGGGGGALGAQGQFLISLKCENSM